VTWTHRAVRVREPVALLIDSRLGLHELLLRECQLVISVYMFIEQIDMLHVTKSSKP